MIAILDPQVFQSQALAWIGVLTVVVGALSGLVALVMAKIAAIKAEAAAKQGAKDHATSTENIAALQTAVTSIALQTTPEKKNGEPEKVEITNTDKNPAIVKETKT